MQVSTYSRGPMMLKLSALMVNGVSNVFGPLAQILHTLIKLFNYSLAQFSSNSFSNGPSGQFSFAKKLQSSVFLAQQWSQLQVNFSICANFAPCWDHLDLLFSISCKLKIESAISTFQTELKIQSQKSKNKMANFYRKRKEISLNKLGMNLDPRVP